MIAFIRRGMLKQNCRAPKKMMFGIKEFSLSVVFSSIAQAIGKMYKTSLVMIIGFESFL